MQKFLFPFSFLIPIHFTYITWVVIIVHFTYITCSYSCSFHFPLMQRVFFSFIWHCSCVKTTIIIHFNLLSCRSCCSCSFYIFPMQKLLFSSVSFSFHAEIVIIGYFTFLTCRSCSSQSVQIPIRQTFFGSVHCSLIQKLIFSFISPSYNAEISVIVLFTFLGMQKFLLLFVSTLPNVKVLILLHFTFLSCRSCYYCSFQVLTM